MGHVPPCYHSQLIIMLFRKRHVLQSINHICSSSCSNLKGTSLRAIIHNFISCVFTKGTSLRAIIQLIIMNVFHEGARPPCYQSHLFKCCVLRKARPPCYHSHHLMCVSRKGTSLRASSQLSSSRRNLKGTSSVLYHTHHKFVFHERHVPPCYHSHHHQCVIQGARPSVLIIASVHKFVLHEGRPSVLSCICISAFRRKGVPPCYHNSSSLVFHERGTSLRAINHISS
jgi:hypothetical protein